MGFAEDLLDLPSEEIKTFSEKGDVSRESCQLSEVKYLLRRVRLGDCADVRSWTVHDKN